MTRLCWLFKPRSHGRKKEAPARATGPRCRGGYQVFACPIDRRLRLCARVGTQHLFVVVRRRSLAGPCASPPSGGHGCPCARPLEAATGRRAWLVGPCASPPPSGGHGCARVQGRSRRPQAGAAWAVVARCVRGTSSRSASAACGVRGVRAAQQRGSRQCDSAEQV